VLGGKIDTRNITCSCECAGILIAVGTDIKHLNVGDRVVCLAPGHFGTHERVPYWAVSKIQDDESFAVRLSRQITIHG
jgi:NADPH:quinone reductase-like Zn-dependent oxidoreductase